MSGESAGEKTMQGVIESAAKTASGEPVWRLTKG